ncbi:hypothetical protein [Alkalihalobacterium chitinilyticum]|uniref:DUF559 domain-containing protein n=1 Tax=Alkalihalobacterium chitinilyticum TaxID=2980103 RepID=A0ABT5VA98_9BACI|nr:hypothetical protein [Alkalihalobacterium chitinilyticum]MDE5412399.1 hypothetical protein [Alkalihalobacterium chitinilyticum]
MLKIKWKTQKLFFLKVSLPRLATRRKKPPYLVPVNLEEHKCKKECERKLYQALFSQNYYVTPYLECGRFVINLALIPFRIAVIDEKQAGDEKFERALKKDGWTVIYYNEEELNENLKSTLLQIQQEASSYRQLLS